VIAPPSASSMHCPSFFLPFTFPTVHELCPGGNEKSLTMSTASTSSVKMERPWLRDLAPESLRMQIPITVGLLVPDFAPDCQPGHTHSASLTVCYQNGNSSALVMHIGAFIQATVYLRQGRQQAIEDFMSPRSSTPRCSENKELLHDISPRALQPYAHLQSGAISGPGRT